jgi:acetylornithine deacetylase
LKLTHTPDPRVPKLPRLAAGTIIGGRGREYDLRGPQNLSDYCTLLVNVRFWKSQSVESIEKDIRRVLDGIATEDPKFKYELKRGYEPFMKSTLRNPKDVPLDSPIIKIIQENHKYVTGETPKFRSTLETTGNDDGTQMNEVGIPTITYGPGPGGIDTNAYKNLQHGERWIDINTINVCTKVLALTALDVCNTKK